MLWLCVNCPIPTLCFTAVCIVNVVVVVVGIVDVVVDTDAVDVVFAAVVVINADLADHVVVNDVVSCCYS